MVDLVLSDPIRGTLCKLMGFLVRKERSPDNKPIWRAKVTKDFTVLIDDPVTVSPHERLPVPVVWAHLRVQITNDHGEISCLPLAVGRLELLVKVLLHSLFSIVCWCIDLADCGVLKLRLKPSKDTPLRDRLPLFQILSSLLWQDQCHTLLVWCIITGQTRVKYRLSSRQMDLPGPCPACFANSQDSEPQPLHFLGNLVYFARLIHISYIPRPDSGTVLGGQ